MEKSYRMEVKSWSYDKESAVEFWEYFVLPERWVPSVTLANQEAKFAQDTTHPGLHIVYWCPEDNQTYTEMSTNFGDVAFPLTEGKFYWFATVIDGPDSLLGGAFVGYAFYHPVLIRDAFCDSTETSPEKYTVGYFEETIYTITLGDVSTVSKPNLYSNLS